ncbi:hypothetical protein [Flavobacterium sp. 3HN19-14]|uniref:hypothetical protein n=1 Tax=Flavobacterium sp. 3HN19-14 TaxID=3448133 RepID=UPI003EDF3D56
METKTKIKGLMVLAFAILFGSNVNAQATLPEAAQNYDQGFRLGFGLSGGYAFEDSFGPTLGLDARLQYDLSKRTSVTLTTGYTHFFVDEGFDDFGIIPVKAGFKGFIYEDSFYLMGEVGAAIPTKSGADTSLLVSPSIGWASKNLDLSLRYEYYTEFVKANGDEGVGQLALRLAYGFRL